MEIQQVTKNSLVQVETFKAEVTALAEKCNLIIVESESTLAVGQQNLAKANSIINTIETLRTNLKAPYLAAGRLIDSTCKDVSEPLVKSVAGLKSQIAGWEKKRIEEEKAKQEAIRIKFEQEQAAIKKEEDRKNAIRDYIANRAEPVLKSCFEACITLNDCEQQIKKIETNYKPREFFQEFADQAYELRDRYLNLIKNKMSVLALAQNSDAKVSQAELFLAEEKQKIELERIELEKREARIKRAEEEAAIQKQQEEAKRLALEEEERMRMLADASRTKGVRYTWAFEVADIKNVPMEWLILDEKKVKEYLKENKPEQEGVINGVRFFKNMNITA